LRITAGIEEPDAVVLDRKNHDVVAEIIGQHGQMSKVPSARRRQSSTVIRANVLDYAKRQHSITSPTAT